VENYFNYFTEIEEHFLRRRGGGLLLSTLDWALIETWKQIGIPLHVALRGIEKAFDSWESKPRKRSVKTLLYCQEEVEAQYAEWLEARVGATDASEEEIAAAVEPSIEPFSREVVVQHLQNSRARLLETRSRRQAHGEDVFCESLGRAAALLTDLENDITGTIRLDAQQLEYSLTGIERMLTEALRAAAATEEIDEIAKEIKKQLGPYRSHMEPAVYEQTVENLRLKRLREQYGVPRLSLFYL